MTNYVTAQGVQNFSIAIASPNLTGTVTINAVGSGAYIHYGGQNPNNSGNPSGDFSYLTLTNPTTITAARISSVGGTTTISGCIVDADTTNLVKSVQFGTAIISSSATSGTSTISAVTNANAAVSLLGWNTTNSVYSLTEEDTQLSLSGTTVLATRQVFGGKLTVGYVVVEFQGSALNQAVQNIAVSYSSSGTSWTKIITSVATANTLLFYGGMNVGTSAQGTSGFQRGQLTDNQTITININNGSSAFIPKLFNCSVVEFVTGVLKSNVQRGLTTLVPSVLSNSTSINLVGIANSGVNCLGNTSSLVGATTNAITQYTSLLDGQTVGVARNSSQSSAVTTSWEVFEFAAHVTEIAIDSVMGFSISGSVINNDNLYQEVVSNVHLDGSLGLEIRIPTVSPAGRIIDPALQLRTIAPASARRVIDPAQSSRNIGPADG